MLWHSRSMIFVRNLRSGGQKIVLVGSAEASTLSLVFGTYNRRPNVSAAHSRAYCSAPKTSIAKCTSNPSTSIINLMPGITSWFELVANVFSKIHVLPASNVTHLQLRPRDLNGVHENNGVIVNNTINVRNTIFSNVEIKIRPNNNELNSTTTTTRPTSSPQVLQYFPQSGPKCQVMTNCNGAWHSISWLGLHHSFAKYVGASWGISRYYHSHSDGVEFELHPNTFNSAEKTRKFVKKLRTKQRALLLTEIQTLNQELNIDVIQEDQNMLLPPSRKQLRLVVLNNAVPFIGFGFLDNAIMIIAGDYIDWRLGALFGISTLAAAGLGNLISDLAGVVLAGYVEAFASKFGIPSPNLSLEQYDMQGSKIASALGRCIGIAVGCLLGMFPLLFLNTDPKDETDSEEEAKE